MNKKPKVHYAIAVEGWGDELEDYATAKEQAIKLAKRLVLDDCCGVVHIYKSAGVIKVNKRPTPFKVEMGYWDYYGGWIEYEEED